MDNKYGLGSTKVAKEHHELHHNSATHTLLICKFCQGNRLILCLTMQDHRCEDCGEWQMDIPQGYSTGRSSDY
ncbi:MAG: hypothetical protein WC733_08825 [Methylophilus sp.]|jgi:hypothetical protein